MIRMIKLLLSLFLIVMYCYFMLVFTVSYYYLRLGEVLFALGGISKGSVSVVLL